MGYFSGLLTNVRFYVLVTSAIFAGGIYFWAKTSFDNEGAQIVNLTQTYALVAVSYLYFTLLASPLVRFYNSLPFRAKYIQARRALGVSVFMFASLHAYFAFFGELGGFAGLPFLNSTYLIAITLSTTSLVILTLMASTAFDFMIDKLGYKRWKFLHRLVYLAAFFTVIHALMLGSAFTDLSGAIPQVFGVALSILLLLEAIRFDRYLAQKFLNYPKVGISLLIVISSIVLFLLLA